MILKILIADDNALMREGIHIVLARFNRKYQLMSATNYEEVLHCLETSTNFGLVLIDLNMLGEKPFTGLSRVLASSKKTPVVVLSSSEDPADIHRSFELGARGFIPKSASNEVLISALELVLSGGVYLPPGLYGYASDIKHNVREPNTVKVALTKRQKEVLELLAQGESNKGISRVLGLSEGTVRTHVNAIFKVLDVNNRTQASVSARTLDLL